MFVLLLIFVLFMMIVTSDLVENSLSVTSLQTARGDSHASMAWFGAACVLLCFSLKMTTTHFLCLTCLHFLGAWLDTGWPECILESGVHHEH